jgi:nicotinamidase-related amidase
VGESSNMSNILSIDKGKTALVVIDMQKGMVSMQTQPYDAGTVLSNNVKLAKAFRENKLPVFLVHVDFSRGLWFMPKTDEGFAMRDMPKDWADISPELGPEPSDVVISKSQWGAFYGTDLDSRLRRGGLDTIVLTGVATTYGVESTARFAYEYGYQQIFAEDAMADLSKEAHDNAINLVLKRLGRVRKTSEILQAIA